jgi:hypothetical protein
MCGTLQLQQQHGRQPGQDSALPDSALLGHPLQLQVLLQQVGVVMGWQGLLRVSQGQQQLQPAGSLLRQLLLLLRLLMLLLVVLRARMLIHVWSLLLRLLLPLQHLSLLLQLP